MKDTTSVRAARKTAIRAGWVVAFDGVGHRIIRNGVVVFAGDRVLSVGTTADSHVDATIDASGKLVIPGLISTHAHIGAHAGDRLILDAGRRDLQGSGFLHYEPRRTLDAEPFDAAGNTGAGLRFGFAALLKSGVTTVLDMGTGNALVGREMVRLAGDCGIRLYYGPGVTSGDYLWGGDGTVQRVWRRDGGQAGLEEAAAFVKQHHGRYDGRVQGAIIMHETFNATPALLKAAKATAAQLGVGISLHCAEQVFEFHEILRTTGLTPVGYLANCGFLGPEVILGHCIYVAGHRRVAYPYGGDLEAIAHSGATIAHSPLAIARRGVLLEDFQRYLDHGINVSIGTDSYPQDILVEMQYASILAKLATTNHEAATAAAVFTAATLGGARSLRRPDLGRLCAGAKADMVIIDFTNPRVGPVFDPIKALLHTGTADLVDRVIIDGITVVEDGQIRAWNADELVQDVRMSCGRVWGSFSSHHWAGRTAEQEFPLSYAPWTEEHGK